HRVSEPRFDLVLALERSPRVRSRTLGADPRLTKRVRAEDGARRVPLGDEVGILRDPSPPPGLAPRSCRRLGVHPGDPRGPAWAAAARSRGSIGTTSTCLASVAALRSADPRRWVGARDGFAPP